MGDQTITCPKCKHISGDDWKQCCGACPMKMSPYYNPNWANIPKPILLTDEWLDIIDGEDRITY